MAEIKYTYIDTKHKLTSYDEIIDACLWIENALKYACKSVTVRRLNCVMRFNSGQMQYECRGIDEFKKFAFGKNIELIDICIWIDYNDQYCNSLSVYVHYEDNDSQKYTLSSDNEMLISDLASALRIEAKISTESNVVTQVVYEDNSVHIGDNNKINESIIGNHNKVMQSNAEIRKEGILKKAFWNIIIPIIVGVIVVAICVWLGLQS